MSSLTEFFRPEHLRPVDVEGYELPPWENPYFQIPPDDDQVEPTAADVAWLNDHPILPPIAGGSPAFDDPEGYEAWSRGLEEIHQASEWQDRLEAIYGPHGITDEDIACGGLPVG